MRSKAAASPNIEAPRRPHRDSPDLSSPRASPPHPVQLKCQNLGSPNWPQSDVPASAMPMVSASRVVLDRYALQGCRGHQLRQLGRGMTKLGTPGRKPRSLRQEPLGCILRLLGYLTPPVPAHACCRASWKASICANTHKSCRHQFVADTKRAAKSHTEWRSPWPRPGGLWRGHCLICDPVWPK